MNADIRCYYFFISLKINKLIYIFFSILIYIFFFLLRKIHNNYKGVDYGI